MAINRIARLAKPLPAPYAVVSTLGRHLHKHARHFLCGSHRVAIPLSVLPIVLRRNPRLLPIIIFEPASLTFGRLPRPHGWHAEPGECRTEGRTRKPCFHDIEHSAVLEPREEMVKDVPWVHFVAPARDVEEGVDVGACEPRENLREPNFLAQRS
ncbi:hypothetical protein EJ06DRAFT_209314 [Trichodelitschia bisporula]|uniref:Uncharacterized protein n=1 Tax=Trichodelitschia bisporula TaxID=703511 RepID=A0A6G1I8B7_9PEZI|nr:hypothetical protein EJ06DRAFT_209314 [Trichodelitschia bisporula]